jgi:4,4'-diaponeurosporenoate glycosyltransferase
MSAFSLQTLIVAAMGCFLFWLRLRRLTKRVAVAAKPATATVSIIIPARNEEHNLPILLASLNALSRPPHEIIVVDDHSEDGTADVARSFGARVIVPAPMAERFIGKTWACQCGADAASGDTLLFTDADTWHAPGSLEASLAELEASGAALLSIVPTHRCIALWERLQGVFQLLLLIATRAGAERDQGYANGQYLLFRRAAYEALSGHRAVSPFIAEDLAFVREARARGLPVRVLFAPDALCVRMYPEGFGAFFAGWRRNFREGMRSGGLRSTLEMTAVMAWLVGAPLCGALELLAGRRDAALLWLLVYALTSWLLSRMQRPLGAFGAASALLYPLFTLVFAAVSLVSLLDALRGAPIKWRGRSIAAVR